MAFGRMVLGRVLTGVICAACCTGSGWAQTRGLPAGAMQEKARILCLPCHDARIIIQQKLDQRAWTRVVDKMIRWGTPVPPEDREPLIEYFAAHYGVQETRTGPAKLAPGAGAQKFRRTCLGCHDADLIAAERLDRRGWARSVEKMERWGAVVRPGDREAILSYLAANFAPAGRSRGKAPLKGQD